MRSNLAIVILAVVALLLAGLALEQRTIIRKFEARPLSYPLDQPFIEKAVAYWTKKNGLISATAMDGRYAKVLHFAKQVCVSLELEMGGVGAIPVYCFDEQSGRLVNHYDGGE